MRLSDERLIKFLAKSPLRNFSEILDALLYLDEDWFYKDTEYELFDSALGDNPTGKAKISVPQVGGITAHALFAFLGHACAFHILRRRPRTIRDRRGRGEERLVFYHLTPAGRELVSILKAVLRQRGRRTRRAVKPKTTRKR